MNANLIVAARHLLGLQAEDICLLSGLSESTIRRIETNDPSIREETILRVSSVLEKCGIVFQVSENGTPIISTTIKSYGLPLFTFSVNSNAITCGYFATTLTNRDRTENAVVFVQLNNQHGIALQNVAEFAVRTANERRRERSFLKRALRENKYNYFILVPKIEFPIVKNDKIYYLDQDKKNGMNLLSSVEASTKDAIIQDWSNIVKVFFDQNRPLTSDNSISSLDLKKKSIKLHINKSSTITVNISKDDAIKSIDSAVLIDNNTFTCNIASDRMINFTGNKDALSWLLHTIKSSTDS